MRRLEFRNILRFWHNKQQHNRVNWYRTLQINFMLLPFNIAKKLPILIYGPCELGILRGNVIFSSEPYKGMLKIGLTDPLRTISTPSFLSIFGNLHIGKNTILRRGTRIVIEPEATLQIQDYVSIGVGCSIQVSTNISIGKATSIGNNTTIMDTDFHYIVDTTNNCVKNNKAPIEIGEHNWIGSYCTIKKGTKTPKGTIIAGPNSMTSIDYTNIVKEYSLIAGSPAKLVAENLRRINNIHSEKVLRDYFKKSQEFYTIEADQLESFCLPNLDNEC